MPFVPNDFTLHSLRKFIYATNLSDYSNNQADQYKQQHIVKEIYIYLSWNARLLLNCLWSCTVRRARGSSRNFFRGSTPIFCCRGTLSFRSCCRICTVCLYCFNLFCVSCSLSCISLSKNRPLK